MTAPIFAIVTPFNDQDEIDFPMLGAYLEFLARNGVARIVVGGTTGEFPSLTLLERQRLLEECRRQFTGEIIAHVSATCAADVKQLLSHAADHSDASLLLPAYYYADAPPAGMLEFLVDCATASSLPLYLYNFPKHTQHPLTPDLLAKARARLPHLRGVKDSSGSVEKARDLAQAADGLEVYVGSDSSALRVLQEGLSGSVTGGGNPVPHLFSQLHESYSRGDMDGAGKAQDGLIAWTDVRKSFAAPEISVVKAALGAWVPGFSPAVRAPLAAVSEDMAKEIRHAMASFHPT